VEIRLSDDHRPVMTHSLNQRGVMREGRGAENTAASGRCHPAHIDEIFDRHGWTGTFLACDRDEGIEILELGNAASGPSNSDPGAAHS